MAHEQDTNRSVEFWVVFSSEIQLFTKILISSGEVPMVRKSLLAGIFSLVIPGLGQMYTGRGERGALILLAAILIGNINAIWLSLYGLTSPSANVFWSSTLPRILHDVCAAWSIVFSLWQVADSNRSLK